MAILAGFWLMVAMFGISINYFVDQASGNPSE